MEKWIIIKYIPIKVKYLHNLTKLSYIKAVKIEKIAILIKISYLINHNFLLSNVSKILVQSSLCISIEIDCLKDEGDLLFIVFEKQMKKKS